MTTILLTTLVDALGGAVPSDATLTATASLVRTDGERVTAPDNLEVELTNGAPASPLDLEAPGVGMFWTLLLRFPQRDRPIVRHVTFPDVETIEWADLTDIDPETAEPDTSLLPVWESLRADVQRFSDSAAESVEASKVARDEAVAAQNAAEAVPAQVDTAMAEQVGSGGEFDTKLRDTFVPKGDLFTGLAVALRSGIDTGIIFNGDSTTTPDTAWARLLANYISTTFPGFTARYWKWDDATQGYGNPVIIKETGTKRRMVMAAGGGRAGRISPGANIAGPIEVIVHMKSPTWNSGATQVIASKWTNDTQVSWQITLGGDGALRFAYSTDGTPTVTNMASTAAHGLTDGQAAFLRVRFTPNDGAGNRVARFDKSIDRVTWTQIGTTVTTAGAATVFQGTSSYSVGARGAASNQCVTGTEFYELWINDGIGGGSVVPVLPYTWVNTIGATRSETLGSPELNFILSAEPGAGIGYQPDGSAEQTTGYLTDPARLKKLTPDMGQQIAFFNSSHNDYHLTGKDFRNRYMGWVEAVSARMAVVERIAITQNPRTGANGGTTSTNIGHITRRAQLLSMAQTERLQVIDTFQAFLDDGRALDPTLIGDTIHPTDAGYMLMFQRIKAELDAALARITA